MAGALEARRLVELRDRWLNPHEWVGWVEEPVPGYPKRPVPGDENAAKAFKKRTLTNLYNARPQWLADAHAALDAAVAAAYGWLAEISDDDVLRELLALNGGGRQAGRRRAFPHDGLGIPRTTGGVGARSPMTDTRQWTRSTLSLLETMPDAVVVVDATGSVVYANRLIEQVFGYSPDALVGRSVEILVPEEARQRHRGQRTDYGKAPAARPMGAVSHVLGLHKSGREFPADISLSPIESDEGWLVIAAVRDMTDRHRIEAALREANDKLGRDLTVAAKIQKSLLPGRPAGIPGVEVDWIYEPCEKLGGDSFNAFEVTAGLIGFYLLDVAGHGTVAALHSMALTRVLASTWTAEERSSPAQLIKWLNAEFPIDPETGQYFTFLCGMLDQATGTLRYACAGHPGPIHVPRGGPPTALGGAGLPVGFFADADYDECEAFVRPGDRLYLYSDGVTEAMNGEHEEFGIAGLVESLTRTQGAPLGDTVQEVRRAVVRWRGREELDDDLTLLAMEVVAP